MSDGSNSRGGLLLIVMARTEDEAPVGIKAAPPHLPTDVWRMPGETIDQLAHRATQMAEGRGAVLCQFLYGDEVRH